MNTKAVPGINPLYNAASAGDLEVFKFLPDNGTNAAHFKRLPLNAIVLGCCEWTHYEVVELLLQFGADLSPLGHSPYALA